MKTNFFGELKDKFLKASDNEDMDDFDIDEDDDDDDYYDDYNSDYEEDNTDSSIRQSDSFSSEPDYDYKYNSGNYSSSDPSYHYGAYSDTKTAGDNGRFTKKQGTNIYQMNNGATSQIKVNRVVYFYLEDRDDARNIADCMVAQDAVVLLDMSKLTKEDAMCVLHFLDGVKYIYKSKMEVIATNVYLIVPNTIELAGDFYDQVSPGIFY